MSFSESIFAHVLFGNPVIIPNPVLSLINQHQRDVVRRGKRYPH